MPEIITLGETMVSLAPLTNDSLQYAHTFEKRIAGAESNVAIALTRLGHSSGFISRLGDDPFGQFIKTVIRGEGVDVSQISFDSCHSTGIMFKQISGSIDTNVFYYRNNSAASRITPDVLCADYFQNCKIFHSTGITAAISECSKKTLFSAIAKAKANGALISFDPNIRLKLYSPNEYQSTFIEILSQTDIALLGIDEAQLLFGSRNEEEILKHLFRLGVQYVGLKLGSEGALVATETHSVFCPAYKTQSVDSVGAGDAFNSGFLCGLLEKCDLDTCGQYGTAMGAMAVSCRGDFENSPSHQSLLDFIKGKQRITR